MCTSIQCSRASTRPGQRGEGGDGEEVGGGEGQMARERIEYRKNLQYVNIYISGIGERDQVP